MAAAFFGVIALSLVLGLRMSDGRGNELVVIGRHGGMVDYSIVLGSLC